MYGSYATHSATVRFNGGVKVKRQPWNILSLTSLRLLLRNLHVIVWQKGRRDSVSKHAILWCTIRRFTATFLCDCDVRVRRFDIFRCIRSPWTAQTNQAKTFSVTECDWNPSYVPIPIISQTPAVRLLLRHQLPRSDLLETLHSLP